MADVPFLADINLGSVAGIFGAQFADTVAEGPAAPPVGAVRRSRLTRAQRAMPAFQGDKGLLHPVQNSLYFNRVGLWLPAGQGQTTVPGVIGMPALTTAGGTATARNPATTNRFTRAQRLGFVSAATAAAIMTWRHTQACVSLGSGAVDGSGFFNAWRFGISDAAAVAGARMFIGMTVTAAALTNVEPSTLTNCIGIGHGAADTNLQLFSGGSAAQAPIDLGSNFPAGTRSTDIYDLILFAPPEVANTLYWEVRRVNTGNVASGTIVASTAVILPQSNTLMVPLNAYRTNNATALAVGLDLFRGLIETTD
jgi:hypothetical protein